MHTTEAQQYLRQRVKESCAKRRQLGWLDVAAAMPHPDDTNLWEILLAEPSSTVAAYTALATKPNAALHYLPTHVAALPADQRGLRVRTTMQYVQRELGTEAAANAARALLAGAPGTLSAALAGLEDFGHVTATPMYNRTVDMIHRLLREEIPVNRLSRIIAAVTSTTLPKDEPLAALAHEMAVKLFRSPGESH